MDLPADIPSKCAVFHLFILHNFRELDLFRCSGTELLDRVTNADESEREIYSQSLLEWLQLTACIYVLRTRFS
jgi:hypothetical protein